MIKKFIEQGEKNKDKLKLYFATNKMYVYGSYLSILKAINVHIFNGRFENITELNFGDYQGTLLYVFTERCYQPSTGDTYHTAVEYGSCEGCDLLLGIINYDDDKFPTDSQIDAFMTLAMHMVQRIKCFDGKED